MKYQPIVLFEKFRSLNLLFRLMLGMCSVVLFSSCAAVSDPGAEILKAKINKNPRTDAIVGMWHRENGGNPMSPYSGTFLFKSDGTAYFHSHEFMNSVVENYEYYYQGQGVWELFYLAGFKQKWPVYTVSLADKYLILTSTSGQASWLYKRQ
jgi:hypothetical protein